MAPANDADDLADQYGLYTGEAIPRLQLRHRLDLVRAFGIAPGMRVLEVGCGQGDTTVALAHAVGAQGSVVATDIASPDYGAPSTLGEAAAHVKASGLGPRIGFRFETGLEDLEGEPPFDIGVLSHCSWYFRSEAQLASAIAGLSRRCRTICLAEWDMAFTRIGQQAHFCAATLAALYSGQVANDGNIQTLTGRETLRRLMQEAGLAIIREDTVPAGYLQDGGWEVAFARGIRPAFTAAAPALRSLADALYGVIDRAAEPVSSLDSLVLVGQAP